MGWAWRTLSNDFVRSSTWLRNHREIIGHGFLYVLIGALIGVPLAGVFPGWADFLATEVAAAWVQAIGTIAALAVAVGLPVYLRRLDEKAKEQEKLDRTFGLIESLAASIYQLDHEASFVKARLDRYLKVAPPSADWFNWLDELLIRVPPRLSNSVALMTGMREDLISTFRLSAVLGEAFSDFVADVRRIDLEVARNNWPELRPRFEEGMSALKDRLSAAKIILTGHLSEPPVNSGASSSAS